MTVELNGDHGSRHEYGINLHKDGLSLDNVPVTATAAELNKLDGVTILPADINRSMKKVTGALALVGTAGGVFSWANPEAGAILVQHVVLNVTTKATGACTIDVGTTATNATTLSDTLIDGVDVNAAAGIFTNDESAGTNGKPFKRLAAGKWVTASVASGAITGLVGTYEIYYTAL